MARELLRKREIAMDNLNKLKEKDMDNIDLIQENIDKILNGDIDIIEMEEKIKKEKQEDDERRREQQKKIEYELNKRNEIKIREQEKILEEEKIREEEERKKKKKQQDEEAERKQKEEERQNQIKLEENIQKILNDQNKIVTETLMGNIITMQSSAIDDILNSIDEIPLINILIRNTYRPLAFSKCIKSVLAQKYSKVNIICSYDDERCLEYLNEYKENEKFTIFPIVEKKTKTKNKSKYKYNGYCNELLNRVDNGWIIFLSDDNMFTNDQCLNTIIREIKYKNMFIGWKMQCGDKIIGKDNFDKLNINDMRSSSFIF